MYAMVFKHVRYLSIVGLCKMEAMMQKRFTFRKAVNTDKDFEAYLSIKSEKDAVAFSGFITAPNRERFRQAYEKLMKSSNEHLYFLVDLEHDDAVAATSCMREKDDMVAEIGGYHVFEKYRGMHLGCLMILKIKDICKQMGYRQLVSAVAENNIASIKSIERSGAHFTGEYDMRTLPVFGGDIRFLHYIDEL